MFNKKQKRINALENSFNNVVKRNRNLERFIQDIAKIDPTIKERFLKKTRNLFGEVSYLPDFDAVSDYLKAKEDSDRYKELKKRFGVK